MRIVVRGWSGADGLLDVGDLSGVVVIHNEAAEADGEVDGKANSSCEYEGGLSYAGYLLDCISLLGSRRFGLNYDLSSEFFGGNEGDDELDNHRDKGK